MNFKELFNLHEFTESKLVYIVDFDKKPNKNEMRDLKKAGDFEVNGKEIETTDKKVYTRVLDIADEIGLDYQNTVETMK